MLQSSHRSINPSRLHHAYGILGGSNGIDDILGVLEKEQGIVALGNPDFFRERFETLTIDDSRRIKEIALGKRFLAEKPRIFVMEIYGATREAQNALLKLFEEPEPGNHFFLVMSSFDILLPTLRSRLHLLRSDIESSDMDDSGFLKLSLKDRMAFVADLAASISDGEMAKHEAMNFLNGVERSLYRFFHGSSVISDSSNNSDIFESSRIAAFEAIARARAYMNDRAPSVKMLLEYVALSV